MRHSRLARHVGWAAAKAAWAMASAPTRIALAAVRQHAAEHLLQDKIACPVCGTAINLLGLWECASCQYSFYGHFWSACEVCGSIPPFVDCGHCGASTKNPLVLG